MLTLDNCITDKKYIIKSLSDIEPNKLGLENMGILVGNEIITRHRGENGAVVQIGEAKFAISKKLLRKVTLSRISSN